MSQKDFTQFAPLLYNSNFLYSKESFQFQQKPKKPRKPGIEGYIDEIVRRLRYGSSPGAAAGGYSGYCYIIASSLKNVPLITLEAVYGIGGILSIFIGLGTLYGLLFVGGSYAIYKGATKLWQHLQKLYKGR